MQIQDLAQLNLTLAGTRQQVTATATKVEAVIFTAAAANTGAVYIGSSLVSSTRFVRLLNPGETFAVSTSVSSRDADSISIDLIYWDGATTNNKLNVGYIQIGA